MTCRAFASALAFAALFAALPFSVGAQAPKSPAQNAASVTPQPAQIDRNGVLILIRSTILALDHANKTGNYTVLRDLGAPGFQANNAARLAEIFATQRRDNLDLSGVAVIDPQLTVLPQIEANGMMRMAGFFPSVPQQVNFEMLFAPVSGQWRLFGLSVNIGQSGPAAPQASSAAAAPPPAPATTPPPAAAPPSPKPPTAKPSAKREPKKETDKPAE
ncbi:MAG: hypothetical protein QOC72_1894 [Methylobacteriaceae bacterium]|nr:hypothetical protein [Methylobacteriaceae bacterium]